MNIFARTVVASGMFYLKSINIDIYFYGFTNIYVNVLLKQAI